MRSLILRVAMLLFPLLTFAQTAPPAAESATLNRGSITGQVLADDGQPLLGVGVNVIRVMSDRSIYRPATTDEEGKFKIVDLSPGSYWLAPQVNGYVAPSGDVTRARYHLGDSVTLTLVKGGVLTGKVLDSVGQPLVGAMVNAQRVRDGEGRASNRESFARDALSDDRGVYRLYGLETGSYVVYVNGGYGLYSNDQIKEVPTYHPNSTRDTAQEVIVQPGLTVQGIDIRHRGERGHAISGMVAGLIEGKGNATFIINVRLTNAATGAFIAQTSVNLQNANKNAFALYGLPDGEYEILARRQVFGPPTGESGSASVARKVVVKGSDVTGVELRLLPLAAMSGRVVLEPSDKPSEKKDCPINRRGVLAEVSLNYQRDDTEARAFGSTETAPDEKNEFKFQELPPGRYRLQAQLPSDHWYVKAMTAPALSATTKPLDIARPGITLKSGDNLTSITIKVAEGAAGLSGRVVGTPGKSLPSRLRVYLVPTEAADDVLRYYEIVTRDGSFSLNHLAPGKYWLHTRPVAEEESDEKPAKPVAWDTEARAKLRREAEAVNHAIELTPCQRVKEYVLKFGK